MGHPGGGVTARRMSTRRITTLFAEVEIRLRPERRVTTVFAEVEYFPAEDHTRRLLNARFNAIRTALHADPTTNIDTLVNEYKADIQTAFGVMFEHEPGADEWGVGPRGFVALHFVRLGLEATAAAFKRWAEGEIERQELNLAVDQYALFRRITNRITFRNALQTNDNFATTGGSTITVWRRLGTSRQAIMTPNNCIHELGHFFSRAAGNNTDKLGSIETLVDPGFFPGSPAVGFNREGMGPAYLRSSDVITVGEFNTLFLEYAQPLNQGKNIVEFRRLDAVPASIPNLSQTDFLMYDILGDKYSLWISEYNIYNIFGGATRIDLFVQNYPYPDASDRVVEIAADALLNWVRNSFMESKGTEWRNFFEANSTDFGRRIGIFMRNTVIYRNGMIQHFQPVIYPASNFSSVIPGSNTRLAPIVSDWTEVSISFSQTRHYGWAENDSYSWFLIEDPNDPRNRLLWRIVDNLEHNPEDVSSGRQINDPLLLSPGREYVDGDLRVILGY